MNFLTTTEHPFSVNGVFYVPEWVCPECILVTRLLKPGGPLFDHITQTFMQLLKPGYPLFEALADKAASKSVSQNVSELDQIFYQPENRTPQPPTPTLVEDPAPEPRPTIAEDSSELQDTPSYADSLSQETPSANSPTIEETTADQTHHKPDPAVQRKTRISQPRMVIYSNDTASTKTAIETALSDIPVSFMRKNSKSIVIGFPNKLCHQKAVKALAPIQDSFNRVSNEALGKITLREVPIDFISEDTPIEETRQKLIEKLRAKNALLKDLEEISVVFFKKNPRNNETATIGIRVPLSTKQQILQQGRLYFGMNSLRVFNRVHVKRCSHCQVLGHYPDRCPNRGTTPVCMFCSLGHKSEDCTVKDSPEKHACYNCAQTTPDTPPPVHNAGSSICPVYRAAYEKASKNERNQPAQE